MLALSSASRCHTSAGDSEPALDTRKGQSQPVLDPDSVREYAKWLWEYAKATWCTGRRLRMENAFVRGGQCR